MSNQVEYLFIYDLYFYLFIVHTYITVLAKSLYTESSMYAISFRVESIY